MKRKNDLKTIQNKKTNLFTGIKYIAYMLF